VSHSLDTGSEDWRVNYQSDCRCGDRGSVVGVNRSIPTARHGTGNSHSRSARECRAQLAIGGRLVELRLDFVAYVSSGESASLAQSVLSFSRVVTGIWTGLRVRMNHDTSCTSCRFRMDMGRFFLQWSSARLTVRKES